MLANADGSDQHELATRRTPDFFGRPAWSPDGKVIATRTGNGDKGGLMCNVVEVRVVDGAQRNITRQGWPWIKDVAWLRDGSSLLTATDQFGRQQIWLLTYPTGEARRITNDFDKYSDLSLTADSNMVTRRQRIGLHPRQLVARRRPHQQLPIAGFPTALIES